MSMVIVLRCMGAAIGDRQAPFSHACHRHSLSGGSIALDLQCAFHGEHYIVRVGEYI